MLEGWEAKEKRGNGESGKRGKGEWSGKLGSEKAGRPQLN